jgi:hypothetical protein
MKPHVKVRTLLKFSSFDDGTPKGEYLKAYKTRKESVVKKPMI